MNRRLSFWFIVLLLGVIVSNASAQYDLKSPVPLDPNVRHGVLKNGLTYYIRANKEPKERASFYIIQNVGAMLENDDQNGLAHFLEHMAFNGTEHFPDKALLNTLEKHGVAFGRNLNAYTFYDETVYNISDVPTTNKAFLDTCLLMLSDWSHRLLLTDKEIDDERGVIQEEWRTRRNAYFRIFQKTAQGLFTGSKYSQRDVIGDLNVIKNFKYNTIRDFYHDWYRTDLQAIAVIGDFDAVKMEEKVKEMFSQLPAVENPKPRPSYEIPGNEKPVFCLATDPEATNSSISIFIKHPAVAPKDKNFGTWKDYIMSRLYNQMFSARISEILQQDNPPFTDASADFGSYIARTRNFYMINVGAKTNEEARALEAIMKENVRVKQHGFTASELERAKANTLTMIESAYNSREKRSNDQYCSEMSRHFLENEACPGIESEFAFYKDLLPKITLEEMNALAPKWLTKENRVIVVSGPEKQGVTHLTEQEALSIIDKVETSTVEPYVDKVASAQLMKELPKGGKVVAERKLPEYNAVEWTLSNGVKVAYRYSDLNKDQILFSSVSPGGNSLLAKTDLPSALYTDSMVNGFGVADYDPVTLSKILTGKNVSVNVTLGTLSEGISGSSTPKDFETMLQLTYLYFEKPRFDQTIYKSSMDRTRSMLQNAQNDPQKVMQDSLSLILDNYHPRIVLQNIETLNKVSFDKIKEIYLNRFKDASDFTFYFVGYMKPEEAKPLIEKYLGSLTSIHRKENWVNNKMGLPKGNVVKDIQLKLNV
ncbi:MAG: insulinase family protein, partial [Bacteroidota bacterium]|nr:insulinase family protein [Bacteroidota bacterium]